MYSVKNKHKQQKHVTRNPDTTTCVQCINEGAKKYIALKVRF